MSAVAHCGDNAAFEGFFGELKRDRVAHLGYRTRDEARAELFNYIERFHNPRMRRRVARQDLKSSDLFKLSVKTGENPTDLAHLSAPYVPMLFFSTASSYFFLGALNTTLLTFSPLLLLTVFTTALRAGFFDAGFFAGI